MMIEESEFREYMKTLEKKILIPGIYNGIFKVEIKIPTRPQRLLFSKFGEFIQPYIDDERVFVVDYYGLIKKSLGFIEKVGALAKDGVETRSILTPVAYFAGVKIEHLSASAPELLSEFSNFKNLLVNLRKFPEKSLKIKYSRSF